jgi:nicotinamide-nucleotide amidase
LGAGTAPFFLPAKHAKIASLIKKRSIMSAQDLPVLVGRALHARTWMMATAESCTGGMIASAITDIAGSSAWFDSGFITYSNNAKQSMLGVSDQALHHHGAVSEVVVLEMAQGALDNSAANISVAVSGIAGPGGGTDAKPVGTVWVAWATENLNKARCFRFSGDRAQVRVQTVEAALQGILDILNN